MAEVTKSKYAKYKKMRHGLSSKNRLKKLIQYLTSQLNPNDRKLSVHSVSVFFAVIISLYSLNKKRTPSNKLMISVNNYEKIFQSEISLLKHWFPDLFKTFNDIKALISEELLENIFKKLNIIFDSLDDDFDNLISWSYQFLKKDLKKATFKRAYAERSKIKDADVLFATQFFTDQYMVRYLVKKSLSEITERKLTNIVMIDVACGGGNFLNYTFEILFNKLKVWRPYWSNRKTVDFILNEAIIGYDLDNCLSKIARLALFVKACSYAIPSRGTSIKIYGGYLNDKLGFLNPVISSDIINGQNINSALHATSEANKIKIFITNPPFMGQRDMDVVLKEFLQKNYPESKGDLCVAFILRCIQLMKSGDILSIVSQNSWMFLSSFKNFRHLFLETSHLKECIDLGSNAFEDINGEKTNVALCVIELANNNDTSRFYNLRHKNYTEKRKLIDNNRIPQRLIYDLEQKRFLKNEKYEFNYQLERRFHIIKNSPKYSEFANPMQGTSTGDSEKFVKFAWEVNGNPDWKLASKGGAFSKWVGLNYFKVFWGKNAEYIKANKGSALRNIDKMNETHLVFSDTGTLGLNVRVLKKNQVFIASGPGIQALKGDKYAHLALLNSRAATFLLKLSNPKFTTSAGYIACLPVKEKIFASKSIIKNSKKCLKLKEEYLKNKIPNLEFRHKKYTDTKSIDKYIENAIINDIVNNYRRLLLETDIDKEINEIYGFGPIALNEIKSVVGESPVLNKNKVLGISISELDNLLAASMDINCQFNGKTLNGYSIGTDNILEYICYMVNVNPDVVVNKIKANVNYFAETKSKYKKDLLHKIILKNLGVENICSYRFKKQTLSLLAKNLRSEFLYIKQHFRGEKLEEMLFDILYNHHRTSFFNKPLLDINNDIVTVGQHYN